MDREGDHSRGATPAQSAESLTASTESETFDSWTVVSEGAKKNLKIALEVPVDEEDEEEDTEQDEEPEKHQDEKHDGRGIEIIDKEESNKRGNESTDDLSDGISIISDSESAGRVSPHPFVRQVPETVSNESEESAKEDAAYDPLTPPTTPLREAEICTKVAPFVERARGSPSSEEASQQKGVRRFFGLGVRGVFAISVIVAILAFLGRMNFWGAEQVPTDVAPLLQKLDELELQNNLLRAEIDILNRQINYMKNKRPEAGGGGDGDVPYKQFEKYEKKPEKPKWAGAGDIYIEPLEPYKKPPPPPYDAEKQDTPSEIIHPAPPGQQPHYDRKPGKEEYQKYPDSYKYPPKEGKYDQKYNPKYEQKYDPKYDPKYQKRDSGKPYKNEDYKKGKGDFYSKEKYYKDDHEKYRSPDGRKDLYSDEGFHEKRDFKKREDDWHEKMMQQREEMRRKQEKHNSNNWYIERGNGRQEARVDSREFRREGR